MTFRSGILLGFTAAVAASIAVWRLMHPAPATSPSKGEAPAKVVKTLKEEEINNIQLTKDAAERLGIKTASVERRELHRVRTYGGEVVVPVGRTVPVAAPMGGELKAPQGGVPLAGTNVREGQPIFLLSPLLTPESRITTATALVESQGQVKNAKAQLDAARIAMDRAQRLFQEQAGSKRSVDECQALCQVAEKTLEAAEARAALLQKVAGDVEQGTAAPIVLESPEDGLLRAVSALPGQNVPAGASLFEVVDLRRVWIRVPIYGGDLSELDLAAEASVGDLSGRPTALRAARPVKAPPTANSLAGTTDLYYELENADGRLAPGQRIGATLTLLTKSPALVVPWSSVVYDIQGGAWVYAQTAPLSYDRRRVQVQFVKDGLAVLGFGPPPGTLVVSEGAAELFGTEVGFSK